jgi:hypothetical protein
MSFDMSSPCQKDGQGIDTFAQIIQHGTASVSATFFVESNLPGLELRNRAMVRLP